MTHPLDRPLVSDLSYEVLQARLRRGDMHQSLDSQNRRLFPLPSELVQREAYIADRDALDEETLIPTWHWHGKRPR